MLSNQPNIIEFLQGNLPFYSNYLPQDSYLVGGAVRDILLQRRREYLDLDFVVPKQAVSMARKMAYDYQAGFVLLDKERQIARVVFSSATIDFAQQEGDTLIQDLSRRDYTINAIACHCYTGEIVDPFNGQKDIENRTIKMVSEFNLADDPLRLLRAYRQASQLNFIIEKETILTIRKLAHKLSEIAPERVNTELGYLLASKEGNFWLKQAYQDQVLGIWLTNIQAEKLAYLDIVDDTANLLTKQWAYFQQLTPDWITLAKLALLTSTQPELAEIDLLKLKYSRQEIRGVVTILKGLNFLLNLDDNFSLREQYFFFLEVGKFFPSLVLLASAYNLDQSLLTMLINRYMDQNDLVAHPQPLLSGNDLINQFNLNPSPLIKELLTEITIAQIEGKIKNIQEALQWTKNYLQN